MSAEYLNENQYHNMVASIACLNDCKLVGLNFYQQIIEIQTMGWHDFQVDYSTLQLIMACFQPEALRN